GIDATGKADDESVTVQRLQRLAEMIGDDLSDLGRFHDQRAPCASRFAICRITGTLEKLSSVSSSSGIGREIESSRTSISSRSFKESIFPANCWLARIDCRSTPFSQTTSKIFSRSWLSFIRLTPEIAAKVKPTRALWFHPGAKFSRARYAPHAVVTLDEYRASRCLFFRHQHQPRSSRQPSSNAMELMLA